MPDTSAAPAASRECDLIMRGGITSGIVYPRAIARLAAVFRFRSIGGTSAGAIAATIAAAAELGRWRAGGAITPFTELAGIPQELGADGPGGGSMLQSLFQPAGRAAHLMRAFLAYAGSGPVRGVLALLRTPSALAPLFAGAVVIALLFGLLPFWIALGWAVLATLAALGAALGLSVWIGLGALPEQGFGLCSGLGTPDRPALTDWMHARIQRAAGVPPGGPPVTFGDLWGAKAGTRATSATAPRQIELVLVTTNLGRGISHRLPFIEGSFRGRLYFREEEMRRLFPDDVVAWLLRHPRPPAKAEVVPEGFHRLPAPCDLPILFGARLSLSFPGLLAQVPLWTPDPINTDIPPRPVRCWFSDGGLTSNFPISLFDAPLPSRPTFGINLVPLARAVRPNPQEPMPRIEAPLDEEAWTAPRLFDPALLRDGDGIAIPQARGRIGQLGAFLARLNDTARNWADTELSMMPGYRDRIVHVALSDSEGGMNLNMPADVIARVGVYGEEAANLLIARYADGNVDPLSGERPRLTWENHRRVRMRTFFAGYEEMARRLARGWTAGDYEAVMADTPVAGDADPFRYKWASAANKQWAMQAARGIASTCIGFAASPSPPLTDAFDTDDDDGGADKGRSPRPKVALHLSQPGDNDPMSEITR